MKQPLTYIRGSLNTYADLQAPSDSNLLALLAKQNGCSDEVERTFIAFNQNRILRTSILIDCSGSIPPPFSYNCFGRQQTTGLSLASCLVAHLSKNRTFTGSSPHRTPRTFSCILRFVYLSFIKDVNPYMYKVRV